MEIAELGKSPHADSLVKTIMEHDLASPHRGAGRLWLHGDPAGEDGHVAGIRRSPARRDPEHLSAPPRCRDRRLAHRRPAGSPTSAPGSSIDEDDAITEAVLNPVVLTMARWHCGQSAILGGTSSIIKPPSQAELPGDPQRHARRAAAPGRVHAPGQHELGADRLRLARGRSDRVRAGIAPLGPRAGAARDEVLGRGRDTRAGLDYSQRRARWPSGAGTPGTGR